MAKKTRQNPLSSHPNFNPLLSVLRAELGLDWGIYNEFLEEVQDAMIAGENLSPWINQIEPLVQTQASHFAHQGVLLLLKEMQWRRSAKDKTGATSSSPSLDADHSSPPKSGNSTEASVVSPSQPFKVHTQMLPPGSQSSALQDPASAPAAPASTAAAFSQKESHSNVTRQ